MCWTTESEAQSSLLRCQKLKNHFSVLLSDTLTIAPETIYLPEIEKGKYQVSYDNQANQAQIIFEDSISKDSILICYRVFPVLFTAPQSNRSLADYQTGKYELAYLQEQMQSQSKTLISTKEEFFQTGNIQKTGSLTRGISIGNTQNMFVNSSLNLQLDGKLTPDLHLTATISDQNIPYQPEGNTQNIREFDRILIQLSHKYASLSAGDIILKNDSSYFLRYYKNVQGGQAQIFWQNVKKDLKNDSSSQEAITKASFAIAKGQFHSTQIAVQDGVLGPYRITGPGNNRFIIILANSERVFLDGKKLERGFDYDYIIDYNTAEITFMPRVLITKFSRVRIDFEFASQHYSRAIQQARHQQKIGAHNQINIDFYREADNPNSPILQQLSVQDQQILSFVGDNIQQAISQNVDTVNTFSDNQILYTYRDTSVNGINYRILVRARNTDRPLLRASFAEVGEGQGNYVLGSPTSNGREYIWVAPRGGIPQGKYEPVRLLIAPNEKQLISASFSQQIGKYKHFSTEWAISQFDKNRFSSKDNQDNLGHAFKIAYSQNQLNLSQRTRLFYGSDIEWLQAYFSPIDRFRYIEFDRDWSQDSTQRAHDFILTSVVGLKQNDTLKAEYKVVYRQRGNYMNGWQHHFLGNEQLNKIKLQTQFFQMHSNRADNSQSDWWRWRLDISRRNAKAFIPGYVYQLDRNQVRQKDTDSVISSAMFFHEQTFYLESVDSAQLKYRVDYTVREDKSPQNGIMEKSAYSETYQLSAQQNKEHYTLRGQAIYRKLKNTNLTTTPLEETVSGRIDYYHTFWQKNIRSELSWQTGSSRELKREFVFIRVENQLGTHTWRDNNKDGIQQLDEFFIAINPDEKNFVKFFVPTDQYIQAFNTLLNYRLNIETPHTWSKKNLLFKTFHRFSLVSSIQTNSKNTSSTALHRLLPLLNQREEHLLSDRSIIRNTLFFNRRNPKIGGEWRTIFMQNKQLLSSGFEWRYQRENFLSGRWNVSQYTNIKQEFMQKEISNRSDFLPSRNFLIYEQGTESSFSYQPNIYTRITLGYTLKNKKNNFSQQGEKVFQQDVNFLIRYSKANSRNLEISVRRSKMDFIGNPNTPAAYEMLEAQTPGINYNWNINYIQRLANGLQLSLNYTGRKSELSPVVHIGRVQITALF
ncbi:MAG: hypothetical protein NZM38_02545 [Cytophagales bacterium]|nr:hypothetical protein [Cytophagales bacterium]MDW8383632.1 hypothetical protein [Flammeovirgaceae bacterium]